MERFQTLDGQWAPVQNSLELGNDPQLRANGFVATVTDADGIERELVANPVQFDETTPTLPAHAAVLGARRGDPPRLGRTDDEIIQLKLDNVVTLILWLAQGSQRHSGIVDNFGSEPSFGEHLTALGCRPRSEPSIPLGVTTGDVVPGVMGGVIHQ